MVRAATSENESASRKNFKSACVFAQPDPVLDLGIFDSQGAKLLHAYNKDSDQIVRVPVD